MWHGNIKLVPCVKWLWINSNFFFFYIQSPDKSERTANSWPAWSISHLPFASKVSLSPFVTLKRNILLTTQNRALVYLTPQTLRSVLCNDWRKLSALSLLWACCLPGVRRCTGCVLSIIIYLLPAMAEAITSDLPVSSIMDRLLDVNICTSSGASCLDSPRDWD